MEGSSYEGMHDFRMVCAKDGDEVLCVEGSHYYNGLMADLEAEGVGFEDRYVLIGLSHVEFRRLSMHNNHVSRWSKQDVVEMARRGDISDFVTPPIDCVEPSMLDR